MIFCKSAKGRFVGFWSPASTRSKTFLPSIQPFRNCYKGKIGLLSPMLAAPKSKEGSAQCVPSGGSTSGWPCVVGRPAGLGENQVEAWSVQYEPSLYWFLLKKIKQRQRNKWRGGGSGRDGVSLSNRWNASQPWWADPAVFCFPIWMYHSHMFCWRK